MATTVKRHWRSSRRPRKGTDVSLNLYVKKPDAPITRDDLAAAIARVPHYGLREDDGDLWVEVPCGDLGSAWLE